MKKSIRTNLPTVLSVIFAIIILVGTFFWFRLNVWKMIYTTIENFMTETADTKAQTFTTKIDDQMIMLESQTRYFKDIDLTDYNAMKETVMRTKGVGAFNSIGVANVAGMTVNYLGKSAGNILLTDYFKENLKGREAISRDAFIDENGEEVMVLSVPIIRNDKVDGAVYGTFTKKTLNNLLESLSAEKNVTNLIMDADGRILAVSENSEPYWRNAPLFLSRSITWQDTNSEEILTEMHNGEKKVITYKIGSKRKICAITPIGKYGWYFATILPETVVSDKASEVSKHIFAVMVAVSLAFVLVFISLLYLVRNNELIVKSNERYKLVTTQTQAIVFEYDFIKQRLEMNGNVEFVFPDSPNVISGDRLQDVINLIHPEDKAIRDEIRSIPKNQAESFNAEARFKCVDDNYYWFKIKGTVVRTDDGKTMRLVGNFINVEEQVTEEKKLKQKAENDPLTGILNKGAVEARVEENLKNATAEDLLALYIVDLDNFKAVNDTLGHAVGDRVLTDVAKKLCIVFSDKDTVGRIGGDEFCVFLRLSPEGRKIGAKIIEGKARSLCGRLEDVYTDGKNEVKVSASVGVALFPQDGNTYADLYRKADAALYAAKHSGKNQFYMYREETFM